MLTIKNLRVTVDHQPIIKGINFTVKPGQVHALMGPNGSGKSTLAYTLAGHPQYQSQGTAFLDKTNLLEISPEKRARLGLFLAFQYPVTIEGVSVQNMLKVAHESITDKPVDSVLSFRHHLQSLARLVDIHPEFLKRSVNDGFSGGEKKRLEIIQMLTLKPKVALLDEIDSGLDIDSIKVAAKGINHAIQKFNTAVIIITHYRRILNFVKPDRIHVMADGKIIKSGPPSLVKELEKSGYQNFQNT